MQMFVPRSAREELKALGPGFKESYSVSEERKGKEKGWPGGSVC